MHPTKRTRRWLFCCLLVLAAAAYPIYMGWTVLAEMARAGAVPLERYPKYIIPYTPIAAALLAGTLLLPAFRRLRRWAFPAAALMSLLLFFLTEGWLERGVLVQTTERIPLESWQMSLCYVPPDQYVTRVWGAVDVLLGGYSPGFKLHFYLISVVLILSLLHPIYGFAASESKPDRRGRTALILQTAAALLFLGMCIWACFTAFYRSGELTVSAISAILMCAFFVLMGVDLGLFAGSFLLGKSPAISCLLPAAAAGLTTLAMYLGEMLLLNGNLYRFGSGFLFEPLPLIVLAPVDVLMILAAAGLVFSGMHLLNRRSVR